MAIDISKLKQTDLEKIIENAKGRLEALKEETFAAFVADVKKRAGELGISLQDLIKHLGGSIGAPGKRAKVQPKFKDPKTGETWAGRGRKPRWLEAYLKEGKKIEQFAIKS